MRHFFTFVGSLTMAALALLGCGSDDDSGPSNNGGSGGSGPTQCVGNNAEFTEAEFLAQTVPDKGCSNDAATVCENDMPVIVGTCGKGCLTMSGEAQCVAGCIDDNLSPNSDSLTVGCLACYGADIECAKANCLGTCGTMPASVACATCRKDNGCADAFYACSGLPEPSGD
jgi:hypothetical protein